MGKIGDYINTLAKASKSAGTIFGSDFPGGAFIALGKEGELFLTIMYNNDTTEKITHDMIKCATVLAMGVVEFRNDKPIYGTKYLCVFKDGRQGVISVALNYQFLVESVIF